MTDEKKRLPDASGTLRCPRCAYMAVVEIHMAAATLMPAIRSGCAVRAAIQDEAAFAADTVLSEVLRERQRQINEEGWTAEHDDEHANGALAAAASAYACPVHLTVGDQTVDRNFSTPAQWPEDWDYTWWKPKDRRRDLIRAAALIVAEIERIDRQAKA